MGLSKKQTIGEIPSGEFVIGGETITSDASLWESETTLGSIKQPPIDTDALINKRIYKVENMPTTLKMQNAVARKMIQADAFHVKCGDGTYYILVHDALVPVGNITITNCPRGSMNWDKVIQILETGYADLSKKKGLQVVK